MNKTKNIIINKNNKNYTKLNNNKNKKDRAINTDRPLTKNTLYLASNKNKVLITNKNILNQKNIENTTIAKYSKSLYYHDKFFEKKLLKKNSMVNISYIKEMNIINKTINDNDYVIKSTRYETNDDTFNISKRKDKNKKLINFKLNSILNKGKNKSNEKRKILPKDMLNKINSTQKENNYSISVNVVIKIQSFIRGYFFRKKIKKIFLFKKFILILKSCINKIKEKNNNVVKDLNDNKTTLNIMTENSEDKSNKNIILKINENININKNNKIDIINMIDNSCQTDNNLIINNITDNQILIINNNNIEVKEKIINDNTNNKIIEELNNNYNKVINENKILEEKLNKTEKDYNELKIKVKQYEEMEIKYNNILKENESIKLDKENLRKQNEKLVKEMKILKDNYNKLLEQQNPNQNQNNKKVFFKLLEKEEPIENPYKKFESANIIIKKKSLLKSKQNYIDNEQSPNKIEENNDDNDNEDEEDENSLDIEIKRKDEEKERLKIKKLKDLVRNKLYEMKDYLHKCFVRFYYNGLYLKMVGKFPKKPSSKKRSKLSQSLIRVSSLNKSEENIQTKKENKINNISRINPENNTNNTTINNNINIITNKQENKKEKLKEELEEQVKRVEKARGLRKLLSRRAKEKNEKLRIYFYKSYRAGVFSKMRSVRKATNTYMSRNSVIEENNDKNNDGKEEEEDLSLKFFRAKSKSVILQHNKEIEELKLKRKRLLESIIFKTDRHNVKVLKNIFEKYYLRSKVLSFNNDINIKKKKKKKKKIGKKQSKSENKEEKGEKEEENNEDKNE